MYVVINVNNTLRVRHTHSLTLHHLLFQDMCSPLHARACRCLCGAGSRLLWPAFSSEQTLESHCNCTLTSKLLSHLFPLPDGPRCAALILVVSVTALVSLIVYSMSALSVPQSSIVKYVGSFSPERLSGGATRLMVLCTIFIYFFTNPVKTEEINLPLASGFRTDPFVYFFAPVWLLYIVLHTSGLYTACAREAMNPSFTTGPCELSCLAPLKKYRLKALQGVGITWSLSCAVLLLVIQHRFNHVRIECDDFVLM